MSIVGFRGDSTLSDHVHWFYGIKHKEICQRKKDHVAWRIPKAVTTKMIAQRETNKLIKILTFHPTVNSLGSKSVKKER